MRRFEYIYSLFALSACLNACVPIAYDLDILYISGPSEIRLGEVAKVEIWAASRVGPREFGVPQVYKGGTDTITAYNVGVMANQGLFTFYLPKKEDIVYKKYSIDIYPPVTGLTVVYVSPFGASSPDYRDFFEKSGVSEFVSSISIWVK